MIIDYMEDHLWSDTEKGGDVWNGRWPSRLIEDLLPVSYDQRVDPADLKASLKWMQRLTQLLQRAQRELYSARHLELMSKEAETRRDRILALRHKHRTLRTQTLFESWRLPYFKL